MGNCLVTKLKGKVEGNFPYYGETSLLKIRSNTARPSFRLRLKDGQNLTVTCDENGLFDNNSRTVVLDSNTDLATLSSIDDNTIIKVRPFYNLTCIITGTNIIANTSGQELVDETILTKTPLLEVFGIRNISSLSILETCTNLKELYLNNSNLTTGDISSFNNLKQLETVIFKGGTAQVTGSLTALATAQALGPNARTSGTLSINCNGTITLNGTDIVPVAAVRYIKFGNDLPSGAEATGIGWAIYSTNPDA